MNGTRTEARFPPDIWSVYHRTLDGNNRTNNHAESAHRRLQQTFMCSHPSLWRYYFLFSYVSYKILDLLIHLDENKNLGTRIWQSAFLVRNLHKNQGVTEKQMQGFWTLLKIIRLSTKEIHIKSTLINVIISNLLLIFLEVLPIIIEWTSDFFL